MRLVGLYREAEYSPGRHRSNDAILLEQVAGALRTSGVAVDLMTAEVAERTRPEAEIVFSMCQGSHALEFLTRWEREGARLINSPRAARNTYRDRLPRLMKAAAIEFPRTKLVRTTGASGARINVNGGLWLKRGDVHASISADVQWIESLEHLRAGLQDFAARGVSHAAIQEHRPGDEIKFYGVAGHAFFHWFYPKESNGSPRHAFDVAVLRRLAEAAASAAGLDIFGGDVIVGPDGRLTVIDLNDWPSFAPCRDAASAAIALHLMRRLDATWNPSFVSSANQSAL
jgi:glutathione synthase/RimK-type ligase-like ATP-grasp enzyme